MTIRRSVNIAAINSDYMAFQLACERTPTGLFDQSRQLLFMLGMQCDALLGTARAMGLAVCNSGGIREIEVLMFDMIRRSNPLGEIDRAVELGYALEDLDEEAGDRLIETLRVAKFMDEDDGAEREAQMRIDPPEIAELQQDGTWAIKCGLAFIKGGFLTETDCEQAIDRRLTDAYEATRGPDLDDDADRFPGYDED